MWRRGLESTLCWRVGLHGSEQCRPSEEIAPSWSWASVDGQINLPHPDPNWESHIKVINVSVELKGEDCFGQVHGGILELECKAILRGMIGDSKDQRVFREHLVAIGKSIVDLRFYWDCTHVSAGAALFYSCRKFRRFQRTTGNCHSVDWRQTRPISESGVFPYKP